jgi:hypothetical protein
MYTRCVNATAPSGGCRVTLIQVRSTLLHLPGLTEFSKSKQRPESAAKERAHDRKPLAQRGRGDSLARG